jgi:hypothetical protein
MVAPMISGELGDAIRVALEIAEPPIVLGVHPPIRAVTIAMNVMRAYDVAFFGESWRATSDRIEAKIGNFSGGIAVLVDDELVWCS